MGGLFGGGNKSNAAQSNIAQGLRVQSSVYGKPLTIVYGTNRVSGNLLWYGAFQAIAQKSSQGSGGKGGSSSGGSVSYTYQAAVAIALCEGSINGVAAVWSGNTYYPFTAGQTLPISTVGLTLFPGTYVQTPWPFLTTNYPTQALNYRGIAYLFAPDLDLGTSADLPNFSFEVMGILCSSGTPSDVNPAPVIQDILVNPNYGCSWNGGWINATLLAQYQTYCYAMNFMFSPVYDSQNQAQQNIQDLLDSTNSTCWWSEGTLKIKPYADQTVSGNGQTYVPNVTPIYALNDDDFIYQDGEDPVQIARSSPSDAYNIVDIEYVDRGNAYNAEIAEAKDLFAVMQYGNRYDSVRSYHHITFGPVAQTVAQLILQRNLYIRNTYTFKLGWAFCALEPMDLVTLTDTTMGFTNLPVRITGVEEDDTGILTFTAEDFPAGFATAPLYGVQGSGGAAINWNVAPVNPSVVIYEPPGEITDNQLTLWIGAGAVANGNYGGCQVWVSVDGVNYVNEGNIFGSTRLGIATNSLPVGTDPDTTDTLNVNLTSSGGVLLSGAQSDADTFNTLCVLGKELISYETATLTGTNQYGLTYLRRGAYGSTNTSHAIGEPFMRIDQSILSYVYDASRIGTTLYFKFVPFNQYESGSPSLDAVPVVTYKITGGALNAPLPNVSGLYVNFVSGITKIFWSPVTDYRPIDYEVRLGQTWGSAQVLGRTTTPTFASQGDGTYWVAAHYITPAGVDVYSLVPADLAIIGSVLVQNVVAIEDQAATNWPGTCSGGAAINTSLNALILDGNNNFLALTSVLTTPDVLWSGGVSASGSYALPSSQTVNAGYVATCSVRISYSAHGQSIYDNVLTIGNVLAVTDWFSVTLGALITATPQIAVAPASGVFGPWQNYQPGSYVGQFFKAQILLTSSDMNTTCEVTDLVFAVDVPDRVDTYTNVAIAAAGTTITFQQPVGTNAPFNGGPDGSTLPNVQVTIINATAGDQVVISKTLSSATVQIMNGGVGVARTVDVIAQGY